MTATPSPAIGTTLPLLITFRRTLFGPGFVVEVKATNGRALLVYEEDGVWVYGVNPGGMAAHGDTAEAAREDFALGFSNVLEDLAAESTSFEHFRTLVQQFFEGTTDDIVRDWEDAVRAIRANRTAPETDLPTQPADAPRSVSVEMKQVFRPADNAVDLQHALAA